MRCASSTIARAFAVLKPSARTAVMSTVAMSSGSGKALCRGAGLPEPFCEPVEQLDPYVEGELLTGDGIDEAFEQAWEARRLEASEALHQRTKVRVALRSEVEVAQVDVEAEHSPKRRGDLLTGLHAGWSVATDTRSRGASRGAV